MKEKKSGSSDELTGSRSAAQGGLYSSISARGSEARIALTLRSLSVRAAGQSWAVSLEHLRLDRESVLSSD